MFFAPGVYRRRFTFGDHSGFIDVCDNNSIEEVVSIIVSFYGQNSRHFSAKLTEEGVYVIAENVVQLPESFEEWKEERKNHVFGECSYEIVERCQNGLIPDLEYFSDNGRYYFAFPDSYKKAKNIPPNILSNVFCPKPGSFYMNVDGIKSGFIPSGIDFISRQKLQDLLLLIDGKNDPGLKKIFVEDNINEDDFDLANLPFLTYGKIMDYLNGNSKPKKQKIVKPKPKKKSNAELKILAEQTKKNTENALLALRDELRRSSGKIVTSDFVSPETTRMRSEFSLNNIPIPEVVEDEDSLSSDTVSSEE